MTENYDTKMKVTDLKSELKLRDLPITDNKTEVQERLQTAFTDEDLLDYELTDDEEEAILTLPADENELLKSPIRELNRSFSTNKPIDVPVAATEKIVLKRKISITPLTTEAPGAVKRELVACKEIDANPKQITLSPHIKVTELKRELKLRDLPITGSKAELQERLQMALIDENLSLEDVAITEEEEKAILTLPADENEFLKSPISELNRSFSTNKPVDVPVGAAKKVVLERKSSISPLTTEAPGAVKDELVADENGNDSLAPAAKRAKFYANPKQVTLSPHIKITELKRELKLRDLPITGSKAELQERLQMALIDENLSFEDVAILGDILHDNVLTEEEEKAILTLPADENEFLKSPISELNRSFSTNKPVDVPVGAAKKVVLERKSSISPLTTEAPGAVKDELVADENGNDSLAPAAKRAKFYANPKQVTLSPHIKITELKRELKLRDLPITGSKAELQERLQMALIDENLSLEGTSISGEHLLKDVLTYEKEKAILTLPADENEFLKSPISELNRSFSTNKPVDVPVGATEKIVLKRKISITPLTTEAPGAVKRELVACKERAKIDTDPQIDANPKQVTLSPHIKITELKRELKLRDLPITGSKAELQERLQMALIDENLSLEDVAILGDILHDNVLTEEEEKAILTLPADENEFLKSPISELNRSFSTNKPVDVPVGAAKKVVLERKSSISPLTTEAPGAVKDELVADENGNDSLAPAAKRAKFYANPKQVTLSPHIKITELKRELKLRDLPITGSKAELQERLQMALIDENLSLEGTSISGEHLLKDVLTDKKEKAILTLPADENEFLKSHISELNSSFSTDKPVDVPICAPKKSVLKRKSSTSPLTTEAPGAIKDELVAPDENGNGSLAPAAKIARIHEKPKQVIKVSAFTQVERLQMRAKKFGINENKLTSSKLSTASVGAGLKDVDHEHVETLKKRTERFGCVESSTVAKLTADERLEKRKQRFGDMCTIDSGKTTPALKERARQRLKRFTTVTK